MDLVGQETKADHPLLRCSLCGDPCTVDSEMCENCLAKGAANPKISRRKVLTFGVVGIGGLFSLGYLGLILKNLYPAGGASATYQKVGPITSLNDDYQLVVYTGQGFQDGVYVRQKLPGVIQAFDFHCAHLQCPVQWVSNAKEFMCPCHGSRYNADGQHIAGPAPRSLYPHAWKIANGFVYIGGQID